MRCRTCDYSLWNLKRQTCPECGAAFRPSTYEFVANSVRFCCPHCDQAYYGTGPTGHLEPDRFDCVRCGNGIAMDEMVLRPAEGLQELQTQPGSNPWLERHRRGRIKGWWGTIGQALIAPDRLARGTPEASSLGQAWWFATVTLVLTFAVGVIPVMCLALVFPMMMVRSAQSGGLSGAPSLGMFAAMMAGGAVFGLVVGFVFTLLFTWMWALVTHLLLRISGSGHGPLRRTVHSIFYSSGTIVVSVVPCVGNLAMLWWIVSAILMVRRSHRVSGIRATFAVLTAPVCLTVLVVGFYAVALTAAIGSTATRVSWVSTQGSAGAAQIVTDALILHAGTNAGQGPAHALELMLGAGLTESQFVAPASATVIADVPVGGMTLLDLAIMAGDEKLEVIGRAAAALPADVVAHRVGDFVFTYHGAVLDERAAGLWVVVMCPDPDVNGPLDAVTPVFVGLADGSQLSLVRSTLRNMLPEQNRLRRRLGLPALPDPTTVTH